MSQHMQRMRRWRMGLGCLVVGGFCVLQLVWPLPARAQQETCTPAILQGGYIWQNFGFDVQGETAMPVATAGRLQVDAQGNITGVFAISTADHIETNVPLTGTVTVQANCTGTITGTDSNGNPVINAVIFVDPLTGNLTGVLTDGVVSFFTRKDGT